MRKEIIYFMSLLILSMNVVALQIEIPQTTIENIQGIILINSLDSVSYELNPLVFSPNLGQMETIEFEFTENSKVINVTTFTLECYLEIINISKNQMIYEDSLIDKCQIKENKISVSSVFRPVSTDITDFTCVIRLKAYIRNEIREKEKLAIFPFKINSREHIEQMDIKIKLNNEYDFENEIPKGLIKGENENDWRVLIFNPSENESQYINFEKSIYIHKTEHPPLKEEKTPWYKNLKLISLLGSVLLIIVIILFYKLKHKKPIKESIREIIESKIGIKLPHKKDIKEK